MDESSSKVTSASVDPTPGASVDPTPGASVDPTPGASVDPTSTPALAKIVSSPPSTAAADGVPTTPATPSTAAGTSNHGADPVLLNQLLEMGVASNLAVRALLLSGNSSVEAAFNWLSELSAEEADALAFRPVEDDAAEWEDMEEESALDLGHKMVLVVDTTLGMKPGKMAAQVGHAVLGLYRVLKRNTTRHRNNLAKWETYGEKMVVVRGNGAAQLRDLRKQADLQRLPAYTVADAGLTQICPGSQTVLAVFGPVGEVDSITGGLKLL